MDKNAWMEAPALGRLEALDGLVWASSPMTSAAGETVQPFVLRDGQGYQPRLMHADGRIEEFTTSAEFGAAYAQANQEAADRIMAKFQSQPAGNADDFAGLDGVAWRGEPVSITGQPGAVPFVLHDGDQFQARLLHPDGGLAIFVTESLSQDACRTATLAAEQWLLEQAAYARPFAAPELFDAKPVHNGPTFIMESCPVDSLIRPVVSQDAHGRFHAQLFASEPGLPAGDMYRVAGPFTSLDRAKDAALTGAFAIRLPAAVDQPYPERFRQIREMAIDYLVEMGEWAASLGRSEDDLNDAKAALLDAADINRLLIQDPDITAMLPMPDATLRDRLAATGLRAAELRTVSPIHAPKLSPSMG